MTNLAPYDDIIDSRDIDKRIEELESEREDYDSSTEWDDSPENEELAMWIAFRDEARLYCSEWDHGETLIRDSYFTEYAQQLAEDIGAIDRNAAWPACHIDWEAAANSLKIDYSSAELDGEDYWFRC